MSTHRRTTRCSGWRWLSAAALAVSLAVSLAAGAAGCSPDNDSEGRQDMQTVAEADSNRQVTAYADQVAAVVGEPLKVIGINASPCEGRRGELATDIYTVQGSYQLVLPQQQHVDALTRTRDDWQRRGYTVKTNRESLADPTVTITASTPDGFDISLGSTVPPTALVLLVHSPCRKSPTPLF